MVIFCSRVEQMHFHRFARGERWEPIFHSILIPLWGEEGERGTHTHTHTDVRISSKIFFFFFSFQITNVNNIIDWVPGVAKSPYSPHANITAIMTGKKQYFVGSPTDFSGTDSAITRTNGNPEAQPLRTNQFDSKWLNEPQFVGSFETDKFVFFLFREAAVEYINCGKVTTTDKH